MVDKNRGNNGNDVGVRILRIMIVIMVIIW